MFKSTETDQLCGNKFIRNDKKNKSESNRLTDFTSMLPSFASLMEHYKLSVYFLKKEKEDQNLNRKIKIS